MARDHQFFKYYFLYVGVISIAMIGIAMALTGGALTSIASGLTVAMTSEVGLAPPEQTALDVRMKNLREVQQALAKLLPSPELLPPITARKTHPATRAISYAAVVPKADHRKSMIEARDAFSHIEPRDVEVRSAAYAEPDRHGVY